MPQSNSRLPVSRAAGQAFAAAIVLGALATSAATRAADGYEARPCDVVEKVLEEAREH